MHIISVKTLREYWHAHTDVEEPLKAWKAEVEKAIWKKPNDIKKRYRSADFLKDYRVVFNIKGNEYRLVVKIHYNTGTVFIRFIGTHAEYAKIDAETI
jgi:mRNA interferase HigB